MNTRLFIVAASCALLAPNTGLAQRMEWIQEFEGGDPHVATDGADAVYVASRLADARLTTAMQEGLLSKYSGSGELLWELPIAYSPKSTIFQGVATDTAGGVYIAGGVLTRAVFGTLYTDSTISKYDSHGSLQWLQQVDHADSDIAIDIAADAVGNAYYVAADIDNFGTDAFVSKLSSGGEVLWSHTLSQLGGWWAWLSISVNGSGEAYVSGRITIDEDHDGFFCKFDVDGGLLWTQSVSTPEYDEVNGIAADSLGNVYVAGNTNGSLASSNLGSSDVFVAKYSAEGDLQWNRQFGTSERDTCFAVRVDGQGGVYVGGHTYGSLADANAGDSDVFVGKLDAAGNTLWLRQFGTSADDGGYFAGDLAIDGHGAVYVSGEPDHESHNVAFLAKFVDVPQLEGDFDSDGDVDGADLLAWQRGASPTPLSADDFAAWQAAFGAVTEPVAPIGVPEPNLLVWLLGAAYVGARCPRTRTRRA